MPRTTSRQEILQFLIKNRTATASEVARAMQMTPANARRHLSLMAADGRIEAFHTSQGARGRPVKVYRPCPRSSAQDREWLVRALLEAIPADRRAAALIDIGGSIPITRGEDGRAMDRRLVPRLNDAIVRLNEMGYVARWEAGVTGPRVILARCPFESLVEEYPELCSMDRSLLQAWSARGIVQTAKLEHGLGGMRHCVFSVE